jgi:hypothetical protein
VLAGASAALPKLARVIKNVVARLGRDNVSLGGIALLAYYKGGFQLRHYDAPSWVDAFGNVQVFKLFIPFMEHPEEASRLHFYTREGEELVLLVPSGYAILVPAAALHAPYNHGVQPVPCNRFVLQVTVGRGMSGPGVPLIPAAPTPLGDRLPAAVVQLVKKAEAAGRDLNASVHAQQGGHRALELGVGGAAANVRAKATADASGGTVTFSGAGGKGGAAANSIAKATVEASGCTVTFGGAGGKGGAAANSLAKAAAKAFGGTVTFGGAGGKGAAAAKSREHTCGFCGKVGHEWKRLQQQEWHEETCPGRVPGGHDCPRWAAGGRL